MKKSLITSLLVALIFASACQKQDDGASQEEGTQDKAMALIEQGKNDEAISLLTDDLKTNPKSETDRKILASAYANRAGIQIQSYYGFTVGYDSMLKELQHFATQDDPDQDLSQLLPDLPDDAKADLKQILPDLYILERLRSRITQIPLVNDSQIKDLMLAIKTLGDAVSPGAKLYRAILEIILMRASIDQDSKLINASAKGVACGGNLDQALRSITFTLQLVQDLLGDIAGAYPSQADDLNKTKDQIKSALGDFPDQLKKVRALLCSES